MSITSFPRFSGRTPSPKGTRSTLPKTTASVIDDILARSPYSSRNRTTARTSTQDVFSSEARRQPSSSMAPAILPGIDVKVGMNQQNRAKPGQSIGSYGFGGCTGVGVINQDGSTWVSHYDPIGKEFQLNSAERELSNPKAKAAVVYTPGEYQKSPEGKWELIPKDKSYETQLKSRFPDKRVKVTAYSKNEEPGKTNDLKFQPDGNKMKVTDGKYAIWPPYSVSVDDLSKTNDAS